MRRRASGAQPPKPTAKPFGSNEVSFCCPFLTPRRFDTNKIALVIKSLAGRVLWLRAACYARVLWLRAACYARVYIVAADSRASIFILMRSRHTSLTPSTAVLVAQSPLPMLPAKFLLQHVQQQQGTHRTPAARPNSKPIPCSDMSIITVLAATADAEEDSGEEGADAEAASERSSAAASRGGKKTRGQ